jgi:hypothetical protein
MGRILVFVSYIEISFRSEFRLIPLTPALSRGERENRSRPGGKSLPSFILQFGIGPTTKRAGYNQ